MQLKEVNSISYIKDVMWRRGAKCYETHLMFINYQAKQMIEEKEDIQKQVQS